MFQLLVYHHVVGEALGPEAMRSAVDQSRALLSEDVLAPKRYSVLYLNGGIELPTDDRSVHSSVNRRQYSVLTCIVRHSIRMRGL